MKITEAKQVREGLYKAIFASLFAKQIEDEQECYYWCLNNAGKLICDKDNILITIQNEDNNFSNEVKERICEYIDCYINNINNFDKIITKYLKENFDINKLAKTDLAVIYTAMCEIVSNKDVSAKIIVNEAVEIAKKYSSDNSYKFINGILRNIVKEYRDE